MIETVQSDGLKFMLPAGVMSTGGPVWKIPALGKKLPTVIPGK